VSKTFIIAEAACTWLHGGLEAAYRSIRAAKECGADAWKTQWTSDPSEMARRRSLGERGLGAASMRFIELASKYRRLAWDPSWHDPLSGWCKDVGIEYICTTFIPKDVALVAPHVRRFKVAAFECGDREFIDSHFSDGVDRHVIVSVNPGRVALHNLGAINRLHCISKYPTKLEDLGLASVDFNMWDGLSDHTTSTLTGAVAVGAGARIIEKHVRLSDTPGDDPDYGHSLRCDWMQGVQYLCPGGVPPSQDTEFGKYVANIREAERML
jgi:sialic acid synthase SpsE